MLFSHNIGVEQLILLLVKRRGTGGTPDSTPNAFSFSDAINAPLSASVESNIIMPDGYNIPSAISITGGEYSINGGAYTSASSNISPGSTVRVRGTSSGSILTTTDVALTIGGVSDTFSITTMDPGSSVVGQPMGLLLSITYAV